MKKYLLIGGKVRSKYDGEFHQVSADKLAVLYNINPSECYFADENRPETYKWLNLDKLIVLRPRYDGDYGAIYRSHP